MAETTISTMEMVAPTISCSEGERAACVGGKQSSNLLWAEDHAVIRPPHERKPGAFCLRGPSINQ